MAVHVWILKDLIYYMTACKWGLTFGTSFMCFWFEYKNIKRITGQCCLPHRSEQWQLDHFTSSHSAWLCLWIEIQGHLLQGSALSECCYGFFSLLIRISCPSALADSSDYGTTKSIWLSLLCAFSWGSWRQQQCFPLAGSLRLSLIFILSTWVLQGLFRCVSVWYHAMKAGELSHLLHFPWPAGSSLQPSMQLTFFAAQACAADSS